MVLTELLAKLKFILLEENLNKNDYLKEEFLDFLYLLSCRYSHSVVSDKLKRQVIPSKKGPIGVLRSTSRNPLDQATHPVVRFG